MKKIFRKEFIVGLCVIVAMAVLFFGINYLKGVNLLKAANYYYASYNNVSGLSVSNNVLLNGYKVGTVRDILYDYEHPGNIKVELALDDRLKLPEGTKAVLEEGLLGGATITLIMGESKNICKVGATIEGVHKDGLLNAVGSNVMPTIDAILPKVDILLSNINSLTGDSALISSIRRLDGITADLQRTASNLAAVSAQLRPVVGNVNEIAGNVNTISSDFTQLSGELKDIPVDSIVENLQATLENLQALSAELNNPDSSLGKIMKDPELYDNINTTVLSLDSLFTDIKKNPKRYINVKVF